MSNINLDMKILVVDDQITMTRIIKNLLGQLHFTNIDAASDGDHAITQLRQHHYSLIISDWNMERVSGL
jgi:two-component system chemotaxis response regulator CheY